MIKDKIISNAMAIWKYLDHKGEATVTEMQKDLMVQEQELLVALGWLSHENKIFLVPNEKELKAIIFD